MLTVSTAAMATTPAVETTAAPTVETAAAMETTAAVSPSTTITPAPTPTAAAPSPSPAPAANNRPVTTIIIGVSVVVIGSAIIIGIRRNHLWRGGCRCDYGLRLIARRRLFAVAWRWQLAVTGRRTLLTIARRRLLLLISQHGLLLQLTVALNERADNFLRHSQIVQINNIISRDMERQRRIVNVVQDHILIDPSLVHFQDFRDPVGHSRGRHVVPVTRRRGGGKTIRRRRWNAWRGGVCGGLGNRAGGKISRCGDRSQAHQKD